MTGDDRDRSDRFRSDGDVDRRDVLKLLGSVPVVGGLLEANPVRSLSTILAKFTGSTDGTADVPTDPGHILGFHQPQIDGIPYGHAGEDLPEGLAGEWADARTSEVNLVSGDDSVPATLFTKVVAGQLYVGVHVSSVAVEEASLSPGTLSRFRIQLDRDGSGGLSTGDVRLTGHPVVSEAVEEDPTVGVLAMSFDLEVYSDGEFVDPDLQESELLSPASAMAGVPEDNGFGIESRLDLLELHERLDDDPDGELDDGGKVNFNFDVSFGETRYGLDIDPPEVYEDYGYGGGYRPPGTPNIKLDNSSVDRIEVTQSVQDETNSLPLTQDKETLARVFVDHPESESITVFVTLEVYTETTRGGTHWQSIGTIGKTFTAPPTPLDREDISHSANFELPAAWRAKGSLILEAKVERPGALDLGLEKRSAATHVRLGDNREPSILYVRVNEGTIKTPTLASSNAVDLVQDGFERLYPIPGANFVSVGWSRLGTIRKSDNLIAELDDVAQSIRTSNNTWTIDIDQIFGHTATSNYTGGLSDPDWPKTSGNCFAAWGQLNSTSRELVMAHEVNHNIGGKTWAKHVAGGCGSGGGDTNHTTRNVGEVGWNPAYSTMVPKSHPEVMTYCTASNPRKWVSPYRWKYLYRRWNDWTPEQPKHRDYRSSSSNRLTAMADGGDAVTTTARVIGGFLYPDGTGKLRPSFEIPGDAEEPADQTDDPDAVLEIEYADGGTTVVSVERATEPIEEAETVEESYFSVTAPDGGAIEAIRLLGPDGDETLDEFEATGFGETLEASLEVPDVETFDRETVYDVGVTVESDVSATLYGRLYFSPDGGDNWLPYGTPFETETFEDESYPVRFTREPGGDDVRFALYVSDGVQTEYVSEPLDAGLDSLPPEVRIVRAHRWIGTYEDGGADLTGGNGAADAPADANIDEIVDVAGPIETVAGATVSLRARGQTERWSRTDFDWQVEVEGDEGQVDLVGAPFGERLIHRFDRPGTYSVTVTATDPETGLTATDGIDVEVTDPPLPDADTVETFSFTPTFTVTAERIVRNEPVQFDASETQDLFGDDAIASYEWDWDGDGEFEETTENPIATHIFSTGGEHVVSLRVTDDHDVTSDPATLSFTVQIRATIDVKPGGGNRNPINLRGDVTVPVAVLHTSAFDPARIDPSTVHFGDPEEVGFDGAGESEGGATPEHTGGHESDVDDDGDVDVVFHFPVADLGFDASTTEGKLVATTTDGVPVFATDEVSIVGLRG